MEKALKDAHLDLETKIKESGNAWVSGRKGMGVRPTHFTHLNIHASFGTNRSSV